MTPRRLGSSRGSVGVVLLMAVVTALCLVTGAMAIGAGWAVAGSRARTAADLAALAAVEAGLRGRPGCAAAATISSANGGRLTSCSLHDGVAEVVVAVPARALPGMPQRATATARAGPG